MAEPGPSSPSPGSAPSMASGSMGKPALPPREIPPMLRPLKFMGVPEAVLRWKPRLPSRNWSIFFTVTGSLSYMYYYDRKQCKLIRQEYIDKVRFLAEQPMRVDEHPRKVRIFSAVSPGDDDPDKSLLYFKKYVKVSATAVHAYSICLRSDNICNSIAYTDRRSHRLRDYQWHPAWRPSSTNTRASLL